MSRVEWLGPREGIEDVLANADLFLSASETESFGLSMLEAMSCGVPAVSTRVGGVAEVLGDDGPLTPLADPKALAAAAMPLLTDPELYQAASVAVRERAVARFSTDRVIDRYMEIYERVIANKPE